MIFISDSNHFQIEEIADSISKEKRKRLKESKSEGEVKIVRDEEEMEDYLDGERGKDGKKKGKEKEGKESDDDSNDKRKKRRKRKGRRSMHRSRPFSALAQTSSDFEFKTSAFRSLPSSKSLSGDLFKEGEEKELVMFQELRGKIAALAVPVWDLRMQLVSGHRFFTPSFSFPSLYLIFLFQRNFCRSSS